MPTGLAVSRVVNVQVSLTPAATLGPNLSTFLVIGASDVIDTVTRIRAYSTLTAVAADFGTSAGEYLAAAAYFGQAPTPSQLFIGKFAQTATAGRVIGSTLTAAELVLSNFTAVTNGGFKVQVNGGALTNVTGINLSGVVNLNGVATAVTTALTGASVPATCTWDGSRFTIKSTTTGATSTVTTTVAPTAGTDIGPLLNTDTASGPTIAAGIAAETPAAAMAALDAAGSFYGFAFAATLTDSDVVNVATYAEAGGTPHVYFVTSSAAGILDPSSTTDLAYLLQAGGFTRTFIQYSSTSPYAAVSAAAKALSVDYTQPNSTITLMFKREPGIVAETLSATQVNALEAKRANVFVNYINGTAIIEQGVCSSTCYLDERTGTDWLSGSIQAALYYALYTSPKIPQTDAGNGILSSVIEGVCAQAVTNGLVAPGTWQAGGFGTLKTGDYMPKGYYIYQPPLSTQSALDRAARKSAPFTIGVKLAGAVHSVNAFINVNR